MASLTNQITFGDVADLADPKIRKIAMHVVREMELTVEKIVAATAIQSFFRCPRRVRSAPPFSLPAGDDQARCLPALDIASRPSPRLRNR
jgi:hypothetical protein